MTHSVFHVGYMKTATTLLQQDVFPRLPDTEFFCYPSRFPHRAEKVRDKADETAFAELAKDMRGWTEASDASLQLFSWEGLVGDYLADYRGRETMIALMQAVAPDAGILLVTRRQGDLVNSLYKQALHRGHSLGIAEFANLSDRALDFDAAVRTYEGAFGSHNVHVVAYEWLRHDPDRFYAALETCFERPVPRATPGRASNVGYKSRAARIARAINPWFRSPASSGGLLPYRPFDAAIARKARGSLSRRVLSALNAPFDPRFYLQNSLAERLGGSADLVPSEIRSAIAERCAASNRALDARLELGLGELGYY